MIAEPLASQMNVETLCTSDDRLVWLTGENFTGRSEILQQACQRYADRPGAAISIPIEAHTTFSTLVPTVSEELMLHLGNNPDAPAFQKLAEEWGLAELSEHDPFRLSGGQQTLLAILCKLALSPRLLALDGALEQLDPANLNRVLFALGFDSPFSNPPRVLMTHNGNLSNADELPISQFPAASFAGIERVQSTPLLGDGGFEPSWCKEPTTIALKDLTFHYPRGKDVFSNLNLTLESGRIYRLAGPNGSGKSTLARLLTGILQPTGGQIQVNGKPFNAYARPGTLARLHFQSPDSQLFEDTVRAELASLPADSIERGARFAGVAEFLNQHPFDFPFVLRKRLALTLILHTSAPWLIFDEPTLGQDEHSRAVLSSAFRRLAQTGHGIIFVSHNDKFAYSVADAELNIFHFAHAKGNAQARGDCPAREQCDGQ
jgi:energy-coupling factor transport system ATP-binding protein